MNTWMHRGERSVNATLRVFGEPRLKEVMDMLTNDGCCGIEVCETECC